MISIIYMAGRPNCRLDWFFDSLRLNNYLDQIGQIIIVDFYAQDCDSWTVDDVRRSGELIMRQAGDFAPKVLRVPPMPNVWAGKYRLTPRNWWHKSTAINTGLCYARGDFLAFCDDVCVLMPTWLDAVVEARQGQWVVAGTYSKLHSLVVDKGNIVSGIQPRNEKGELIGEDPRMADPTSKSDPHRRRKILGDDLFGCTYGLPTEWALQVNGADTSWDSVSMEDIHFGKMLENNGFPIYHDGRMKIVEDRTPMEIDPNCREHDMKRSSKEKHPNDQSDKIWTLKRRLWRNKRAAHSINLREIRERVLNGGPFPIPNPDYPDHKFDWFDGQPLSEMT